MNDFKFGRDVGYNGILRCFQMIVLKKKKGKKNPDYQACYYNQKYDFYDIHLSTPPAFQEVIVKEHLLWLCRQKCSIGVWNDPKSRQEYRQ